MTPTPNTLEELLKWAEICNPVYEPGHLDDLFKRCTGCPYKGKFGCANILVTDLIKKVKEIMK